MPLPPRLFCDTSFFYACFDRSDVNHRRARSLAEGGLQRPENPFARCGVEILSIEAEKERLSQCGGRGRRVFCQRRGPDQSLSRSVHRTSHFQALLSRAPQEH